MPRMKIMVDKRERPSEISGIMKKFNVIVELRILDIINHIISEYMIE